MLRKMTMLLFAILVNYATAVVAADADVDFSKAYVIPEQSTINKLTIGGVKPLWTDLFYSVDFTLKPDYSLSIVGVLNQFSLAEQLEQALRNSKWQGTYLVYGRTYTTTLDLRVVQDGYIGGEVSHINQNGTSGFLTARLTGDILTQYAINGQFVDQDRIAPDVLKTLPLNTTTRQLVRIKRMRALTFQNNADSSGWSTNREYRMTLQNGKLTGVVGIPAAIYGVDDGTTDNGTIELTRVP